MLSILLSEDSDLIVQEVSFVILVSIAALIAIIIRRIRLPYTVALVLAGLALSFSPRFLNLDFISSELILAILVPPLLFEATLQINWADLRRDLLPVLLMAIVGTLVGTFIVGAIVLQVLDIPFAAAIVFGAMISATDPVAVIAFFRSLGVSKRLALLVEGESLVNDGVAVVIFNLALAASISAASGGSTEFALIQSIMEFGRVSFGGLGVGFGLGYIVSQLILKHVDDHLIETATTVALAFGAFVVAEEFALSGILAVVAAGLVVGNIGLESTSPTTRVTLNNFWEFMAFVVNSLVFLVIGLKIGSTDLTPDVLLPTAAAVLAVLLSRVVIVYGLTWLNNLLLPVRRISPPFRHVMYWGGLRGAISLALALTLPGNFLGSGVADTFRIMTFGVVLFTLLVQGTTIGRLISILGLARRPSQVLEHQRQQALLYAKWTGQQELNRQYQNGILFRDTWEAMNMVYEEEIEELKSMLREHLQAYPELEQEMFMHTRGEVLQAEKGAISDAARRGMISDELHDQLMREADRRAAAIDLIKTQYGLRATKSDEEEVNASP